MKKQPWLLPISSLRQGENRLSFDLDIEELGGTEQEVKENPLFEQLVGPVRVELVISRSGKRLLVEGRARFTAKLDCAMCCREFERGYDEPLVSEFLSTDDEPVAPSRELEQEELGRSQVKGNMLDLRPEVTDAIHLAIPMAPSCSEDCKGLCAQCGADLNRGPCGCTARRS
jgi:uncharacterized protein